MGKTTFLLSLAIVMSAPLLGGCFGPEEGPPVELTYERPAKVQIPEKVKRLGIAQFTGQSETDQRWGDISADKLAGELDKLNRSYHRYELVDRRNLAKVLNEQDIRIMNSDQAVVQGKLANVQAMVFGNIRVNSKDDHLTRSYFDVFSQTMKTKPYTKRFCLVSVNLTMTDIDTAKTIHTFTITKEFDSEKDGEKSAVGQFLGFSSDSPPPVDQTVNGMVDLVVQEFCQQISPHRQAFSVKLEGGKTKAVEKGNTLAKAKDYAGALEMYEAGLAEKPDDDGAAFNAGMMYEAQGDFANAEKSYQKAFKLGDNKQKYADAKQRVRQEGNGSK